MGKNGLKTGQTWTKMDRRCIRNGLKVDRNEPKWTENEHKQTENVPKLT